MKEMKAKKLIPSEEQFKELFEEHLKHSARWQPKYVHLIAPFMGRDAYRKLIGAVEEDIFIWVRRMIFEMARNGYLKDVMDWYIAVDKAKQKRFDKTLE